MRRPVSCLLREVKNCEDCEHWEPIPFHFKGGECLFNPWFFLAILQPICLSFLLALDGPTPVRSVVRSRGSHHKRPGQVVVSGDGATIYSLGDLP